MNENVNELLELLKKTKEKSNEMFDYYIDRCKTNEDVIEIYLRACYQTNFSIFVDDIRFRTKLNQIFNKSRESIKMFRDDVVGKLPELNNDYKNSSEHFQVIENEIKNIRRSIDAIVKENVLVSNLDSFNMANIEVNLNQELNTQTLYNTLCNIIAMINPHVIQQKVEGQDSNFKICNCLSNLVDNMTGQQLHVKEQYIVSQFPGHRDINIGVYTGKLVDGRYFVIPLGTKYVIKTYRESFNGYLNINSYTRYCETLQELKDEVISIIFNYAKLTHRIK